MFKVKNRITLKEAMEQVSKRNVLKEAVLSDPEKGQPFWDGMCEKAKNQLFFRKLMKLMETEGTLQGDVDTESDATNALGVVYDQIVMGVEEYHPLDFARIFNTTKSQLVVPIGTHGIATKRAAGGAFAAGEKTTTFATIDLDEEYGLTVSWTKAHLEDATWDVLAEQMQGAGYGIQHKACERLLREAQDIDAASLAGGAFVTIASRTAITWAEFLAVLARTDVGGVGMADYCLVSPARYWQLLALPEFVSSLYAGSDEVMRSGIAKLMMGVTVIKVSDLGDAVQVKYDGGAVANLVKDEAFTNGGEGGGTGVGFIGGDACISGTFGGTNKVGLATLIVTSGTILDNDVLTGSTSGATIVVDGTINNWADIIAVNKKKALALVYRRNIEVEPQEKPDENWYGFVASIRAKADALVNSAIAIGLASA